MTPELGAYIGIAMIVGSMALLAFFGFFPDKIPFLKEMIEAEEKKLEN